MDEEWQIHGQMRDMQGQGAQFTKPFTAQCDRTSEERVCRGVIRLRVAMPLWLTCMADSHGAGKALPIIYMGVSSRRRHAGCDQLVGPRWLWGRAMTRGGDLDQSQTRRSQTRRQRPAVRDPPSETALTRVGRERQDQGRRGRRWARAPGGSWGQGGRRSGGRSLGIRGIRVHGSAPGRRAVAFALLR